MKTTSAVANFAFFVLPLLFISGIVFVETVLLLPDKKHFYSEYGILEILQVIVLSISLYLAGWLWFKTRESHDISQRKWLGLWMGAAIIGVVYTLGEEISWGQTYFHWQTPENWAKINGQEETNLHNTSHLLNQLPKAILEIGVLVGGLIIPALQRWKPEILPQKFAEVYPGWQVSLMALVAFIVKLPDLIPGNQDIFWRKSEVIESALYYFVLIYLIYLCQKWGQKWSDRKPLAS